MNITPIVLFHDIVPSSPGATVYTVPGTALVVVRRCLFVASAASSASLTINGKNVIAVEPVSANRRLEQVLTRAIGPGDTIAAASTIAGALQLLVEGFTYS